jgi:hypothetical protein
MDVVEFLGEDPLVLCVVDFEAAVWGDAEGVVREGKYKRRGAKSENGCLRSKERVGLTTPVGWGSGLCLSRLRRGKSWLSQP